MVGYGGCERLARVLRRFGTEVGQAGAAEGVLSLRGTQEDEVKAPFDPHCLLLASFVSSSDRLRELGPDGEEAEGPGAGDGPPRSFDWGYEERGGTRSSASPPRSRSRDRSRERNRDRDRDRDRERDRERDRDRAGRRRFVPERSSLDSATGFWGALTESPVNRPSPGARDLPDLCTLGEDPGICFRRPLARALEPKDPPQSSWGAFFCPQVPSPSPSLRTSPGVA